MVTKDYIEMCEKATVLQSLFLDESGVNGDMLPAFLFNNSTKETQILFKSEDKLLLTNKQTTLNNLIWIPTIEQIINIYKKYVTAAKQMLNHSDIVILACANEFNGRYVVDSKDEDIILYASKLNMNQLFLLFMMYHVYGLAWNIYKREWIVINEQGN